MIKYKPINSRCKYVPKSISQLLTMQYRTIVFTYILCMAWSFNFYKIPLTQISPYHIFPWSAEPQTAKTDPTELTIHVIISLGLITASYLCHLFPKSGLLWSIHFSLNGMFVANLLPNLTNFGDFSQGAAFAINGITLLVLQTAWLYGIDYFFVVLSTPVLIEVLTYYKMLLGDLINMFFDGQLWYLITFKFTGR